MAGLAMATMVPSRATIMTPTATVTSVSQGCPRIPRGAGRSENAPGALSPDPVVSMVV